MLAKPGRASLALGVLFLLALGFAAFTFLNSPYFRLERIDVLGASRVPEQEIRAFAGVKPGESLLRIRPDRVAAEVSKNPWVKEVRVRRVLPGKLEISVVEREPLARIPYYGFFVSVDAQGVALALVEGAPAADLAIVTGVNSSQVILGQPYPSPMLPSALSCLSNLSPEARRLISEVHLGDKGELTMYTLDGVTIRVGQDGDLQAKMKLLEAMLQEARNKKLSLEYIDLRYDGKPVSKPRNHPCLLYTSDAADE